MNNMILKAGTIWYRTANSFERPALGTGSIDKRPD